MKAITLFGISNCDTVRKARKWLAENQIEHTFHDFRKDGLSKTEINHWLERQGWEALFNKRSTSYRALPDEDKTNIDQAKAIELMLEHPTLIKRPVLLTENSVQIGFKAEQYQELFN
ncbi:ArsC family reductase [Parashewanella tropica]|uniref:ArsC family reductase n=1 Tax=Parashewanella tropica TaxID=2547970 RepID=UPI001059EA65|nr:ArsC family reductase [Parashewanella tropica]